MHLHILFFGILKEVTGRADDSLELPAGARVRDVLAHYESQHPGLKSLMPSIAVAVNQNYARLNTPIHDRDEIALLPPVSGGSPAHVAIVRDPIDTQRVLAELKSAEDGAAVVFEGVVRNQTRGRQTLYLDYEAYEPMALQQMEGLAAQAMKDFKIRDVALVHRLGRLAIGETSVLIVVASAHRAAAFDACRWLIDTLKRTVPIWKKEHFEDGAVWADGEPFPAEIRGENSRPQGSPEPPPASK